MGAALCGPHRLKKSPIHSSGSVRVSGSLDEMSAKVASFYEAEVDNAVDAMSSLLEPLIMVILGVLVGGLVIAMYLPIFNLGKVV